MSVALDGSGIGGDAMTYCGSVLAHGDMPERVMWLPLKVFMYSEQKIVHRKFLHRKFCTADFFLHRKVFFLHCKILHLSPSPALARRILPLNLGASLKVQFGFSFFRKILHRKVFFLHCKVSCFRQILHCKILHCKVPVFAFQTFFHWEGGRISTGGSKRGGNRRVQAGYCYSYSCR